MWQNCLLILVKIDVENARNQCRSKRTLPQPPTSHLTQPKTMWHCDKMGMIATMC